MTLETDFCTTAAETLLQDVSRLEVCMSKLTDEQIWMRAHETDNACGNLCLHLAGNVRQWIIANLGGEPDRRTRDAEFAARSSLSGAELTTRLRETVDTAVKIIRAMTPQRLVARHTIQGYEVSGLGAIFHVTEHFSGHTGQIILLTKMLTGTDLGFYRHLSTQAGVAAGAHSTPTGSVVVP
jgi:hypothetical protein